MIKVSMFQGKWKVEIENENWQIEDIKNLQNVFNTLIMLKDKYGRIK